MTVGVRSDGVCPYQEEFWRRVAAFQDEHEVTEKIARDKIRAQAPRLFEASFHWQDDGDRCRRAVLAEAEQTPEAGERELWSRVQLRLPKSYQSWRSY